MKRRRYGLNLVVTAVCASMGGALMNALLFPSSAEAQADKAISARKFQIVDAQNRLRGYFGVVNNQAVLMVQNASGESLGHIRGMDDAADILLKTAAGRVQIVAPGTPKTKRPGKADKIRPKAGRPKARPSIALMDERNRLIAGLPGAGGLSGSARQLPPVARTPAGPGKADVVSEDIQAIWVRIESICDTLDKLTGSTAKK